MMKRRITHPHENVIVPLLENIKLHAYTLFFYDQWSNWYFEVALFHKRYHRSSLLEPGEIEVAPSEDAPRSHDEIFN